MKEHSCLSFARHEWTGFSRDRQRPRTSLRPWGRPKRGNVAFSADVLLCCCWCSAKYDVNQCFTHRGRYYSANVPDASGRRVGYERTCCAVSRKPTRLCARRRRWQQIQPDSQNISIHTLHTGSHGAHTQPKGHNSSGPTHSQGPFGPFSLAGGRAGFDALVHELTVVQNIE